MEQQTKLLTCKTPNCGRKFTPHYRNGLLTSKYCPNCRLKRLNGTSTPKSTRSTSMHGTNAVKKESNSVKRERRLADDWFSRYIRIKYAYVIQDGVVYDKCIITGCVKEAKYMDNGHCYSRGEMATRYNENNCRPQNRSSNRFSGEADHYTFIKNLIRQIGEQAHEKLLYDINQTHTKADLLFFTENKEKYKKLTNELCKEHNIKKWW